MNNLDEILNKCMSKMRSSADFDDYNTIEAINELLTLIISNPQQLINYKDEEHLSLALSTIFASEYPNIVKEIQGINTKNLVFAVAYYLFMHQLDTGRFYDKNWPAFIVLMHKGIEVFANFIIETNPFAPEKLNIILGDKIDMKRAINAAKGFELNLMLTAKGKGYLTKLLMPWYNELFDSRFEILGRDKDPFKQEAIPLYEIITNYIKANDVSFVKRI